MDSNTMDGSLTKKQIERQDFVDNEIFSLLQSINPTDNKLDWNIEIIADIREKIRIWFEQLQICDEQVFYPNLQ